MKKIIVTSFCALAVAGAALGQGTVNWGLITPAAMTAQTNSTQYSPLLFGGGIPLSGGSQGATASASTGARFYYALLYASFSGSPSPAPTTIAALNNWQETGLMATNSNAAGRLAPINPSTHATVPWDSGVTNSIMLVGWSASLGSTWSAAHNVLNNWATLSAGIVGDAFFGVSTIGYITPFAFDTNPGAIVFGTDPVSNGLPINSLNTQLFTLFEAVPSPEPGTLALAGLGGLVLLALRRRK